MFDTINKIREQFPILSKEVYSKPLVYFDNAATAQKPIEVISMTSRMFKELNGNVHRAPHKLSNESTLKYEQTRDKVKEFLNAAEREEIIFTSGTTASINLVANSFAKKYLKRGDSVILSQAEHHSNIVPWQMLRESIGIEIKVIPVDDNGRIMVELLPGMINKRVKLIAVTHISNVTGLITPVKDVVKLAHENGIPVLVDGAQGIVHSSIDVKDLDCDFYTFSAHKLYGPTGVGILYGKKSMLESLPPWMGGGDMIESVSFEKTEFAQLPLKFEAGTPNYIGVAATAAAIDFVNSLDNEFVLAHEKMISAKMEEQLRDIKGLKILGSEDFKIPLFSFVIKGVHPNDLAILMDKMGVALRSGRMCAEPLVTKFGVDGIVRASLLPYNTLDEVTYFGDSLRRAVNMLIR